WRAGVGAKRGGVEDDGVTAWLACAAVDGPKLVVAAHDLAAIAIVLARAFASRVPGPFATAHCCGFCPAGSLPAPPAATQSAKSFIAAPARAAAARLSARRQRASAVVGAGDGGGASRTSRWSTATLDCCVRRPSGQRTRRAVILVAAPRPKCASGGSCET